MEKQDNKNIEYYLDRNQFLLLIISDCIKFCRDINTNYKNDKICKQFTEDILQAIEHAHYSIDNSINDARFKINNIKTSKYSSLENYLKATFKQEGTGD